MFYVYILLLSNKTYYHGYSSNLKNRLREHSNGAVSYTRKSRPTKLVYYAAFESKKKRSRLRKILEN